MSTTTATSAANLAALANASVSPLAPVVAPVALGVEYERDASHVKKCAPFVQKIYGMVSEPEIDAVVTWTAEGNSFVVLDTQAMQDVILPRYFKHNNFASFVRQLNMYGFRKVGSPSNIEFYQDSFLRGRTELLVAVKRRKPGSSKAKKAAAAAAAAAKGGKVSGEAAATFSADIRGLKRQRVELEGSITSLRASQDRLAATLTKVAADNARLQADLMASRERHQEMSGAVQSILALLANAFPQAAGMVAANTNNTTNTTTNTTTNNNNHFGAGRVTPTPSEPVSPMSTSTTTTATTFVPSVGVYNDTHDDPHAAPMSTSSDLASEDVTASLSDAPPAKRAKTAASVAAGGSTLASTGYLAQANHQHGAGGLAGLCRDQQVYASAKAEAVAGLASSVETPMALPSSCNQDSIWQAATNLNLGLVGRNEVSSKAMAADQHLGVDFLFDEATFDDIFATPTAGAPVASAESVVPTASPRAIDAAHMSVQAAAGDFGLLFDLIGSN